MKTGEKVVSDNIPEWIIPIWKFNDNAVYGWEGVRDPRNSQNFLVDPIKDRFKLKYNIRAFNKFPISIFEDTTPDDPKKKFLAVWTINNYRGCRDEEAEILAQINQKHGTQYVNKRYNLYSTHRYNQIEIPTTRTYVKHHVFGEFGSMKDAKKEIARLRKEHINPTIARKKKARDEKVRDQEGEALQAGIGGKHQWKGGKYIETDTTPACIGDYVIFSDRNGKYRGWVFRIEREDFNLQQKVRIVPVYCGIEQKDFKKHKRAVCHWEIEHVDLVSLGRSFQQLKQVIDDALARKS